MSRGRRARIGRPGIASGILAALVLGACHPMSAASHQFGKAQPGCSETTTLRDFDGTLHVFGCGSVKTYRCSRTWALPGTRLEPVYVDGYATSYDASGHRTMISSRETSYRSVPTSSGLTSCTEIGDALPPDP